MKANSIKTWIGEGLAILACAVCFYFIYLATPGNPPEMEEAAQPIILDSPHGE